MPLKSDVKIMKFFRYLLFSAVFVFLAVSCKKETKNIWNVEIKDSCLKTNVYILLKIKNEQTKP